jgi:hypothetical protein
MHYKQVKWKLELQGFFLSFIQMQSVLLSLTSTGMRHRDRKTTGNVMGSQVNSGLKLYFFGPQCTRKLTAQNFIEFQQKLQKEVLFLEVSFDPLKCNVEIFHCKHTLSSAYKIRQAFISFSFSSMSLLMEKLLRWSLQTCC